MLRAGGYVCPTQMGSVLIAVEPVELSLALLEEIVCYDECILLAKLY